MDPILTTLAVLATALALLLAIAAVGRWLSAPGHQGPTSAHFDGQRFRNLEPTPLPGPRRGLRLLLTTRFPRWVWRDHPRRPPPPARVDDLRVTFLDHASALIQTAGLNLLTDPVWSGRCSAVSFAGPKRHRAPGLPLADLPPIDAVLLSHNHYDHLDLPTLKALRDAHDPVIVTGLGVGRLLARHGFRRVVELDWGDGTDLGPLRIIAQPTRHFSGRGLFDRMRTLWVAFVVDGPAGPIYFGGDTGYGDHFCATGDAHGPFRLALLPIGAYGPRWFMGPIHMDPAQAVRAHHDLGARTSVGIHFGTFRLTSEAQDAPVEELAAARTAAGLTPADFAVLEPGEGRDVRPLASGA